MAFDCLSLKVSRYFKLIKNVYFHYLINFYFDKESFTLIISELNQVLHVPL